MLDKFTVARTLREIAALKQLKGENPFKVRAYEQGARAVEELTDELARFVDEGRLTEVRGIGVALASIITEVARTGTAEMLEQLRKDLPRGVLEMSRVPNLGPKKAQQLSNALGLSSLAELKQACEEGRVAGVKGFGEKTQAKILEGIARLEKQVDRVLLVDALELAERLLAHLRGCAAVSVCELAGSARRLRETVADLDLVAASDQPARVMDELVKFPLVMAVEGRGDTKCSVRLASGMQVDLRVVAPADFATALHHFTGSKEHHVKLRGRARARGLSLSEYGLTPIDGDEKIQVSSESELYAKLDLPFIPPELREDCGEMEAADAGDRFGDLIALDDVAGMVHCHTTYSDGKNSVEEMARAAEAMGMKYLTITDHSPSAFYASGVKLDRLKAQWDEIARVQESVSVRILRGTESDILESGALDYPDQVLELFEVIIASVHSRFQMDEQAMTQRLVTAMRQPVFKIWGHALGRLLLRREPFACRVEEVLDAIAESRAAIEVNGDPHRMDLEPRWIREARKRGIKFVVSTDAHSTRQMKNLRFGVAMARRGGVRRGELLNALPVEEFCEAVKPS